MVKSEKKKRRRKKKEKRRKKKKEKKRKKKKEKRKEKRKKGKKEKKKGGRKKEKNLQLHHKIDLVLSLVDIIQGDDVRVTNLLEDIDLCLNGDFFILRLLLVNDFHRKFLSCFLVKHFTNF